MKVGDLYQNTAHDNLIIVGVVSEASDQNGYFEAWEITVRRSSGSLSTFSAATHKEGRPGIVRLFPESAAPALVARTEAGIAAATAAVDRQKQRSVNNG